MSKSSTHLNTQAGDAITTSGPSSLAESALLGPAPSSVYRGNTKAPDLESLTHLIRSHTFGSHPHLPASSPEGGGLNQKFQFHLNQYRFLKVLGKGTFAVVQEAEWLPKCEHVAVKMISKSSLVGQEQSLHAELDILSRVRHPNLLQLRDWGFGKQTVYIVTELARGGELFDRILSRQHFYEEDAKIVIKTILDAVDYLHSENIIHRDLKPENVFLREPWRDDDRPRPWDIVIGDFGISRFLGKDRQHLRTRTGSYGYMAPEVLSQMPYGQPCDLWSIGVITYVLLSGLAPYRAKSFDGDLDDILNHTVSFSDSIWEQVSSTGKDFIAKLLKLNPGSRMTAREALNHPWLWSVTEPHTPGQQKQHDDAVNRKSDSLCTDSLFMEAVDLSSGRPDLFKNIHAGITEYRSQKQLLLQESPVHTTKSVQDLKDGNRNRYSGGENDDPANALDQTGPENVVRQPDLDCCQIADITPDILKKLDHD